MVMVSLVMTMWKKGKVVAIATSSVFKHRSLNKTTASSFSLKAIWTLKNFDLGNEAEEGGADI